ncbi:MAG: glycosyltransferase family 9 protein [Opitutales bacterium]
MQQQAGSFYNLIREANRVLVLDLGFLGDTIHLIPALRCLREALPGARLDVMVAEHIRSILQLTPWVEGVLGYRRFPKSAPLYRQGHYIRELRSGRYDAVINLNGSDRSSILTRLSGAPLRLGRRPKRRHWYWPLLFTHRVTVPFGEQPLYQQRWECLQQAGFPGDAPRFAAEVPAPARAKASALLEGAEGFFHVSPSTTLDYKDLPLALQADMLNALQRERGVPLVLSAAPNDRERARLQALCEHLDPKPLRTFAGDLNLVELAAVIERSSLHLGGDSGALHIAFMLGVPTVSWFRRYADMQEWLPSGERHRAVIGVASPQGLQGLTAADFVTAVQFVLDKPEPGLASLSQ